MDVNRGLITFENLSIDGPISSTNTAIRSPTKSITGLTKSLNASTDDLNRFDMPSKTGFSDASTGSNAFRILFTFVIIVSDTSDMTFITPVTISTTVSKIPLPSILVTTLPIDLTISFIRFITLPRFNFEMASATTLTSKSVNSFSML